MRAKRGVHLARVAMMPMNFRFSKIHSVITYHFIYYRALDSYHKATMYIRSLVYHMSKSMCYGLRILAESDKSTMNREP